MLKYTKGFKSALDLADHFLKHGSDFGAATADDYETLADQFLGGPLGSGVHECTRVRDQDSLRLSLLDEMFGALTANGMIRTLFKPRLCASFPANQRAMMRYAKRCHPYATNLVYFQSECAKR